MIEAMGVSGRVLLMPCAERIRFFLRCVEETDLLSVLLTDERFAGLVQQQCDLALESVIVNRKRAHTYTVRGVMTRYLATIALLDR